MAILQDKLGRRFDYLRVSVTDRCNLKCFYCNPSGMLEPLARDQLLSFEEIVKVVRAGLRAGIRKVRLTGGEPLVRTGIEQLCAMLNGLNGLEDLSLTTNGILLADLAESLYFAGVRRINVSLDTLRSERFRKITGRPFSDRVLAGLQCAEQVGFDPIKINMVVMRGVNDGEIADFARLALVKPYHVRFIELMPIGFLQHEHRVRFVPMAEIAARVKKVAELSIEPATHTSGPERLCSLAGSRGKIGFIAPVSRHICSSCNRLRLTADGRLRPCLFSDAEVDIRWPLRQGFSITQLAKIFHQAADIKPSAGSFRKTSNLNNFPLSMQSIGG